MTGPRQAAMAARAARRMGDVRIRLALADRHLLSPVFRARYDAYRAIGKIPAEPSGMFWDSDDLSPNAWHVVATRGLSVCGALRLHVCTDPDDHSPTGLVYPREIGALRTADTPFFEAARFFTAHPDPVGALAVIFLMFSVALKIGLAEQVRVAVMAVAGKHPEFYESFLGFQPVSDWVAHPPFGIPHVMMTRTLDEGEDILKQPYPFVRPAMDQASALVDGLVRARRSRLTEVA